MKNQRFIKKIHKHVKKHHRKYVLGAGIGFLVFKLIMLIAGGLGLIGDNFTKAEWNGGTRNNDVFIDQTFWDNSPSNNQIKEALFGIDTGDETAYTENRSGNNCDINNITVEYKDPGTDSIPQTLSGDTIYVLNPGDYIISYNDGISMSNCSAIIGINTPIFYSVDQISSPYAMVYANLKQNNIVDNVKINGKSNGQGGIHAKNTYGIYFYNSMNNSINNVEAYNHGDASVGAYFSKSSNNSVNNSKLYNNYYGILFNEATDNTINNSQAFNNIFQGMLFSYSTGNAVNNSQAYNNYQYGIIFNQSNNNIVNNSQAYNNTGMAGIGFFKSYGNIINESQSYNNMGGIYAFRGDYGEPWIDIRYYGNLTIFSNEDYIAGNPIITTGSHSDITGSAMGWQDGLMITTGQTAWNYMANPVNVGGTYLLPRGDALNSLIGPQAGFSNLTVGYSYGNNIPTQKQPVYYKGDNIVTSQTFDNTKYVGSDVVKNIGTVSGIPVSSSTTSLTLNVDCPSNATTYKVLGDVIGNEIESCTNTTKSVTLSGGDGEKIILVKFNSTTGSDGSHVGKSMQFMGPNVSRDNDNFITGGFWSQGPSDQDIKEALFGVDTGDDTAYTDNRSGNNCDINNITVEYKDPGTDTIPQTLSGNTIYVLNLGNYIISYNNGIWFNDDCSAIVGNGDVALYSADQISAPYAMIYANFTQSNIVDNVKINGKSNGLGGVHAKNTYGVYFYNSMNNSINNVEAYNHGSASVGAYFSQSSNNNVSNSKLYNNYYGILFNESINNTINNSQAFNNTLQGMLFSLSTNNTVNNSQSYSNYQYGIEFNEGNNNIVNNSQAYNNSGMAGIGFFKSYGNIINESQSYNNLGGIYAFTDGAQIDIRYYGNLTIFGNDDFVAGNPIITTGSHSDITGSAMGWQDGLMITTGQTAWNYMANPVNVGGTYLLPRGDALNSLIGPQAGFSNLTVGYSYGNNIPTQKQPVYYKGDNIVTSQAFDNTKYIGSDIVKNIGSVSGVPSSSSTTSLTLNIDCPSNATTYKVLGDVTSNETESCSNTTKSVTLSGGDGEKTIIIQFNSTTGSDGSHVGKSMQFMGPSNNYTPDQFSFVDKTGAELNTLYTSNIITIAGMSADLFTGISVDTGYMIKNGINIGQSGTGGNDDQFILALTSSNNYTTDVNATMIIAGIYDMFSITTKNNVGANYTPNQFSFVDKAGAELNTLYTSNIVTIAGMSADLFTGISVNAGYMIKNGVNIGQSGTGGNDDQFILALTSSNNYTTDVNATMIIAGIYDMFSITTKNNVGGQSIRDNGDFIDETFWSTGPTSGDIKNALFGSGINDKTAYTQNRSGNNCNPNNITVQYLAAGINTVPQQLSGNKIYVLDSGDYEISYISGIWLSGCSAIIGNGNVKFYSTGQLNSSYAMIYASSKIGNIIDNINVDGRYKGIGGTHTDNERGLSLNSSKNHTINNSEIYMNHIGIYIASSTYNIINDVQSHHNNMTTDGKGIYFYFSNYNIIDNSQIYNNYYNGIVLYSSNYNAINNSQTYNNLLYGIALDHSTYNVISNSQSYNQDYDGMYIYYSDYNIIDNSRAYNNKNRGIYFYGAKENIIHDFQAYNNQYAGITASNGCNRNKYYGDIKAFSNSDENIAIEDFTDLLQGYGQDFSGLGWEDGYIDQIPTIDCSRIINPINDLGGYLNTSSLCNTRGQNLSWTGNTVTNYRYGSNTLKQAQTVKRSSGNIIFYSGEYIKYNTGRYIGQYGLIGGTFNINNGSGITYKTGAKLYNHIDGVTQMRFANLINNRSGWSVYNINQIWSLSGSNAGVKNVYADFSGDNGVFMAMDTITYEYPDLAPDQFYFTRKLGVATGTLYSSNTITLAGISPEVYTTVTLTGSSGFYGYFYKNGIAEQLQSGTGHTDDTFTIYLQSSNQTGTKVYAKLIAGGISGSFEITTFPNLIPDQFYFNLITGADTNTLYTSNIITLTGMTPGAYTGMSVDIGYIIKNGNYVGQSGTGGFGDNIVLAFTSSVNSLTRTSSTLAIGGTSGSFFVRTKKGINGYIDRDNQNFIDNTFWSQSPNTADIKLALFGEDVGDKTAYTQIRSGNYCNYDDITVQYITGGLNKLPQKLSSNTIYVLNSGDYKINYASGLEFNGNCIGIIGSGNVTFYSTGTLAGMDYYGREAGRGMIWGASKKYTIIDNINIDGKNDGYGGFHVGNANGITYRQSSSNTINNIEVYNHNYRGVAIGFNCYFWESSNKAEWGCFGDKANAYNTINNSRLHDNQFGGIVGYGFSNSIINNIEAYSGSGGHGVHLMWSSDNTLIKNIKTYNNGLNGITVASNNATIENIEAYNNDAGVAVYGADHKINNVKLYHNRRGLSLANAYKSIVNNIQTYNNEYGIWFRLGSSYGTINNAQLYNNSENGVYVGDDCDYISINNSQAYNNRYGIFVSVPHSIINNSQAYNNNMGGFSASIINNSKTYDISMYGIHVYNNTKYYGNLNMFANGGNTIRSTLTAGTGIYYSSLGRTTGSIDISGSMDCSWVANPVTTGGMYLQTGNLCNVVGQNLSRVGKTTDNYRYGSNVLKQKQPVSWSGEQIVLYGANGTDYNTGRYIGQHGLIGGTFDINNNSGTTYTTGVTLYNHITGVTQMKFSNDLINRNGRNVYSVTGSWNLDNNISGLKNVYADFSGDNGVFMVMDTINYVGETDTTPPTVSTTLIYSGITGNNGATLYKIGAVDAMAYVNDNQLLNIGSCQYTYNNGQNRYAASYSGSANSGYCYFSFNASRGDLYINFRVKDNSDHRGTGTATSYIADGGAPTFTFANNSGYECVVGTMSIKNASDAGIGLHATAAYSFDGVNRGTSTGISVTTQQPGIIIKTGYVRDVFGNISVKTGSYTFNNSPITSNNFTGSNNVGNSIKTGNWKILSNASDLWCGSGDVSFSGIISQGTKGNCTVDLNNITYTPNQGQTGNDICTIQIKDNENSTANITIIWGGINTVGLDTIPDQFNFINKTGAELNTLYTSNIVTITGMSAGVSGVISVDAGYMRKNSVNIGQSGTGGNGDQFILVLTSSNNYATDVNATMTIAGVLDIFSITTKDPVDLTPPLVSTSYIYSGTTGYNNPNYYYKGAVDIKADISDNVGISGSTCEYTLNNGTNRYSANYNGSACYKTGIVGGSDLNINFKVKDIYDNQGTGTVRNYLYDIVPPLGLGSGDYLRAVRGGGTGYDEPNSIAVDNNGNTYVAGHFAGTAIFGSTILTGGGSFIAKISSTGEYLWAKKGGSLSGMADAESVTVDNSGNSYIVGRFSNTGEFGSIILTNSGNYDTFIAKLSPSGEYLRAKKGGGWGVDRAKGVAVDGGGNSYMVGYYNGTANFGSLPPITTIGSNETFIAKLSSTGLYLWIKTGGSMANSIALDDLGNIFIAGQFGFHPILPMVGSTITFGSTTLVNSGNGDTFIAKMSSSGEYLRAQKGGGSGYDLTNGVTVDNQGNSYIAGIFQGTGIFGSTTLVSNALFNSFVAKISPSGEYLRANRLSQEVFGVTVDDWGNIYIAGNFEGTGIFGSTTLISNNGYKDSFIAKLSSTGSYLRAKQGGGSTHDDAFGVASDHLGNSYVAGYFVGTGYFGSTTLVSNNSRDVFIAKIGTVPFVINGDSGSTNSANVTLNITCPIDEGIGGIEIAYGNSASPSNRTGCASTKSRNLTALDGTKTVYMTIRDALGNIVGDYTDTIILSITQTDLTSPVVGVSYIYNGTTGYNNPNYYYKGNVDIKADVSDAGGISGATCQYTTNNGTNRDSANYNGSACYKTGIVGGADLNINFKVKDTSNNVGTGTARNYVYDNVGPSQVVLSSPTSGVILNTGTTNLTRSTTTDGGIGLSGYYYQVSTDVNFGVLIRSGSILTTGTVINGLSNNSYYRKVYAFDKFNNTGTWSNVSNFTIDTTAPTITIYNPNTNPEQSKTISGSTNEGILYQVVTNGTTCDGSLVFGSYQALIFTSESNNGNKVCYKAVDSIGNTSYSMSNAIQGIDRTNPTITVISPSANIGTSGILLSINTNENAECRYSTNVGTIFTSMTLLNGIGTSHTGNYTANEGVNNIYFKCKDLAGNISNDTQHIFTLDSINPVVQFVVSTLPTAITNNNTVNISITGTNLSAYKYQLLTGSSCAEANFGGATGSLTTPITQGPTTSDQTYSYCIIGYNNVAGRSLTGNKYTFIYDNTAPVITINDGANPNRNTGDNINLNVNYNLAGASGTKYVEINNSTCSAGVDFSSATNYTPGTNVLINNESHNGKYLCFKSIDLAGNMTYTGIGNFKIDISNPLTNISDTVSNRRNTNAIFSLTCNDLLAGCQNTYYKTIVGDVSCDGSNYLTYAGDLSINANGGETLMKSVCYYSVDALGNNETFKKQLYKIDKQGPSITLVSPSSGSSNNGSSRTFVRSGVDNGVGISGYHFRLYSSGSTLITGITLSGTNIVISNLLNGDYLWNVEGSDILGNTGISNIQAFSNTSNYVILPYTGTLSDFISAFTGRGYLLGSGAILFDTGSLSGVLVGVNDIYFGYSNEIKLPIIMSSTGSLDRIEIKIESGTLITKTGLNASGCEDLILTPSFVPSNIAVNLATDQDIFSTFMLGNSCNNVFLKFVNSSGGNKNIAVRVHDRNLTDGEYNIRYSENGIDRDILGISDYEENLEFSTNHMTYFAITQDKDDILDSLISFLGGGGKRLYKDNCKYSSTKKNLPGANEKGKDYSDSYYDKDCGENYDVIYDGSIEGSKYSDELNKAYLYSYRAGITTIPDVNRADMMGGLYRKHMAKMLSNYAINILGKTPDDGVNCDFVDMGNEDQEMQEYATKACQLGLMGLNSDGTPSEKFYPGGLVTRSQFGTALSRLLYGDEHNASVGTNRYEGHLVALKNNGIVSQISKPNMTEKRGYVMLMIMRAGIPNQ